MKISNDWESWRSFAKSDMWNTAKQTKLQQRVPGGYLRPLLPIDRSRTRSMSPTVRSSHAAIGQSANNKEDIVTRLNINRVEAPSILLSAFKETESALQIQATSY